MNNLDCIILCGGKCGSSTLNETMINNNYKSIKIHNKHDFIKRYNYDGLIDSINLSSSNKKVYLIDSYRTPLERKISSFFENISKHVPNYTEKSMSELIDIFNDKYLNLLEEYHSINIILDEYKLEHFKDFDFEKRYAIKEYGNIVFIKLLFKDINNWGDILSNIFNKEIKMHNSNISDNKSYKKLYELFKKHYKVPQSYIENNLKNDVEFKIYNTSEEQNDYINKLYERLKV